MKSSKRWIDAQEYERGYWGRVATEAQGDSEGRLGGFYRWRAEQLQARLDRLGQNDLSASGARLLEIGSGPVGLLGSLPASSRIAVDPLEDYYGSIPTLIAARSPEVSYLQGTGEALPVEDASIDLVIMENCIDHCQDMSAVMAEIRRALTSQGRLYLTVNARCNLGYWIHRVLSMTRIDAGHPHTFTLARVGQFLEGEGFSVLDQETGSFREAWLEDLRAHSVKQRLKGLMLVSEFLVSVVAIRTP